MTDAISQSNEFLLLQIAQITVAILVVGLITRLVCRNRPYVALALWLVVLIKCVVPPLIYSPSGVFCWVDSISHESPQSPRTRVSAVDSADWRLPAVDRPLANGQRSQDITLPVPVSSNSGPLSAARAVIQRVTDADWTATGLAVWLAGSVSLLLVYAMRCHLFLKRIERERQPAPASDVYPTVERLVRRLSRYVGLRRVPRVVLSQDNVGPAVFGLWRPTVILPTSLVEQANTRSLAPIVLHELMHIRRGDLWLALHSTLVRAIWWFHPLVWWSVRRAEWESERCCDESVVACMRRGSTRYALSLINTLELSHRLKSISLVPGVRPVDITAQRLERIMKLGQGSHRRMPVWCWCLAILAAALLLPGAAGSLAQSPGSQEQVKEVTDAGQPGRTAAATIASEDLQSVRQASYEPLPTMEGHSGSNRPAGPSLIKIYLVADLLDKLKREDVWPDGVSDEQIKQALVAHLRVFSSGLQEPPGLAIQGSQPSLGHHTHFEWSGDQLVVSGPEAAHKSLVREIERRRGHSFRQVSIEVRILQGSPDLCAPDDAEAAATPDDGNTRWKNRWILFQRDLATEESGAGSPLFDSNDLDRVAQVKTTNRPSANVTTGKSDPIFYQFADHPLFRSFIEYCQGEAENSIILAPKVTLFDGQTAEISDCSQRPFVTDVAKVVGDEGVAYQPIIRVFWEGTKIQLAPAITPDGHHVKCRIRFASIDDCKEFRPPRYPEAKGIRVQHPVISTASFECAMDIPTDQTLLIGGLFPRRVVRDGEQSVISRLLGRQPPKVASEQMTYIAITPRTVSAEK